MATLNEIAYDIFEHLRPEISDDDHIDISQIKFNIHTQRSLWLRNELNKNRTIDENIIQDLGCIELDLADRAECCDIESDCTILRTKVKIPKTLELHNKTAITRVGFIDKLDYKINFISYERAKYAGNSRFNKKMIYAFLLNGYIYLYSNSDFMYKFLTHINIRGVFENPTEAAKFNTCEGEPCYSDDMQYPLSTWMIPYIKGEVLKFFQLSLQVPNDNTNNAKPDNTNEAKPQA
jgi:hypothetical protein